MWVISWYQLLYTILINIAAAAVNWNAWLLMPPGLKLKVKKLPLRKFILAVLMSSHLPASLSCYWKVTFLSQWSKILNVYSKGREKEKNNNNSDPPKAHIKPSNERCRYNPIPRSLGNKFLKVRIFSLLNAHLVLFL